MASETEQSEPRNLDHCFTNYILADVGSNLTNKKFSRDIESVIARAKDAGVCKIIVTATSVKGSKESLRLARLYPGILYATAGIHPHDGKSWSDSTLQDLTDVAKSPECVAIGLCGLDYNKNYTVPGVQRLVFKTQVELACNVKKPLIIHERDAHDDLVEILCEFGRSLPPVILHSYSGNPDETKKYLDLGMYFSITGLISKDNADGGIQELLHTGQIPLDHIMVQSDAPFMYPNARGKKLPDKVKETLTQRSLTFLQRYCTFQRNEPCSLPVVVEMLAGFLDKPPEDVALGTTFNALKIFSLD